MRSRISLSVATTKVKSGYWYNEDAQRDALERLGKQLGVKELDDWYSISSSKVQQRLTFIQKQYKSLFNALKTFYPQHNWDPLRFSRVSRGYWNDKNTQREALERLGRERFGVKELDDWYSVNASNVRSELTFIHKYYHNSLYEALKTFYPQHNWDPLRFSVVPRGYWSDLNTQRAALERVGREKFGVKELDHWYSVSSEVVNKELSFISNYYNSSLSEALKKLYPNHGWNPQKFGRAPSGYWKDETAQREALDRLGDKLGVKELDDWYSVSSANVYHELSFMSRYTSMFEALKKLYPQHDWDPLKFSRIPSNYWTNEDAQREALEKLGREKFGVKELNDWYSVSTANVRRELGFMNKYGSLFDALKKFYPQHDWNPQKFVGVPRSDVNTQRAALEKFGNKLGVKELDDWYSVSAVVVHRELQFIKKYKSLFNALKTFYPQHNWDPLRFSRVSRGYWNDLSAQREALERLGRDKLGVKELSDWYSVPAMNVHRELAVLNRKYGSLYDVLKNLYPHHEWDPLRFNRVPFKFWQQEHIVNHYHKLFAKWREMYNIRSIKDWYEMPPHQLEQFKRASNGIFGSSMKMLQEWFPEIVWKSLHTSQVELQSLLRSVIDKRKVNLSNQHQAVDTEDSETNQDMI